MNINIQNKSTEFLILQALGAIRDRSLKTFSTVIAKAISMQDRHFKTV